jgi:hypothetical protein
VVSLAFGVGCSFDSTPRIRHTGPAAADHNVVGLFYDGGRSSSDAGSTSDANDAANANDAADAHDEPGQQSESGMPTPHDSAVKTQDPSQTPDTQSEPSGTMSSDAAMPGVGEPMAETPPPASDAATPAMGAAGSGSTSPPRSPMLQLLKAAQFSRDDRAITAILGALVAEAKSGADLAQVLSTLDSDGQCAFIDRVTCLMACGVVATRCSLCISDPDCAAELRHVCGVGAPYCR